ncbi:MAG: DNA starvation/stationary phase protection protein [Bacilli bacterium]|nr:DNA starvation/stationary phase protection protein [Bacilli bacterium]
MNNNLKPEVILNQYLSNLKVLNNNLYNLHFNVIGNDFFTLHLKLDDYYRKVADMYDEIAERIKMIGSFPVTSLTEYEEISTIKSMKSQNYTSKQVLDILENSFSFMISLAYDLVNYFSKLGDDTTSGIISSQLSYFEKQLWMVKASKGNND